MNFIITGEVRSGKTTWCTGYYRWLEGRNFKVGGVLCPEARNHDIKVGYDIVDVRTGQSIIFGRSTTETDFHGEVVGDYQINYDGIKFANEAILEALELKCDMIFIDEIGHLELAGKGIFESAKATFRKAPNTTAIVRKTLLPAFLDHFRVNEPEIEFVVLDLELDTNYPFPCENTLGGSQSCFTVLDGQRL